MAKLSKEPAAAGVVEEEVIPWRPIFALAMCQACHSFTLGSLFSYAGLLCVDLAWARDENAAGYTAGYLAGALTFGRIFTSIAWGKAADAYGIRPCLVASCVNVGLGNFLFGFATRLPVALVVRCLFLGAGNGLVTLQGPACIQIGGLKGQSFVFGRIFAAAGAVQVLAPSFAGLTYGYYAAYPALVPSLVGAAFGLTAAAVAAAWLPPPEVAGGAPSAAYAPVAKAVEADAAIDGGAASEEDAADGGAASEEGGPPPRFRDALLAHPVPLVGLMRALLGWLLFASFEVIPLWTISDRRLGGLGWDQRRLGLMLGAASVAFTLWMVFGVPRVVRALGVRRGAAAFSFWLAAALCATPGARNYGACLGGWIAITWGTSVLETLLVAATNNAAPHNVRGAVTGAITTFEAVAKALGPPSAATLYAVSIDPAARPRWLRAALGHRLAFVALAAAAVSVGLLAPLLPNGVENDPDRWARRTNAPAPADDGAAAAGALAAVGGDFV